MLRAAFVKTAFLFALGATAFAAEEVAISPGSLPRVNASIDAPTSFLIKNPNGNIAIMSISGESVYAMADGYVPPVDGRPAKLQLIQVPGDVISIEVVYPTVEVSFDGSEVDLQKQHDPARGFIVRPKGIAIAGFMSIKTGLNFFSAPGVQTATGPVGVANLTVGIPKELLANLWVDSVSGDIRVSDFPTDPTGNRILLLETTLGEVSVKNTPASGLYHDRGECKPSIEALALEIRKLVD